MESLLEVYCRHRVDAPVGPALKDAAARAEVHAERWRLLPETFGSALAALPEDLTALSDEAVVELALALACGRADREALEVLDTEYFAVVRATLRSMGLADALVDDLSQDVRARLLVADGDAPPRLIGYAGRGSLRGLLKAVATRAAISHLRRSSRELPHDRFELGASADPELAFLKEKYRGTFRQAFEEAVAALPVRERNLLRLHFLRKMTLDALATMYGVHRATIVRQLARARDKIDAHTAKAMRAELRIDAAELESVMDLIRSRFEVSVERIFRS
jgi:RNA polymerase sigma-70 factor (ECF subfamily)